MTTTSDIDIRHNWIQGLYTGRSMQEIHTGYENEKDEIFGVFWRVIKKVVIFCQNTYNITTYAHVWTHDLIC